MIYEGEWGERIDVAEALRLMIEQIAGPIQILSGSVEVAPFNFQGQIILQRATTSRWISLKSSIAVPQYQNVL